MLTDLIREYWETIVACAVGLFAWLRERKKNKATVVKLEGENVDQIINRLTNDNKHLASDNKILRDEYRRISQEKEELEVRNEQLLDELHELKIKVAELTNQIIRLEAKFRLNSK